MAAELIHSNIKLSIGILVSNRMETIRKCMDSLVPLLREIPSELIALDTVGEETDGSINVVREYTDKIYRYQWCNDFADARNNCLSHAVGEWFLFLDDDEWFDNVDDLLAFFKTEDCEKYRFGTLLIRNYTSSGKYNTTITTRMIRRTKDTHFVGRIHEIFHEVCPPGKQFESFLHHSGYAFANEEEKKKHQERNMPILVQEIEDKGISPRLCAQMVQELFGCKETTAQGFAYCMEYLPILKEKGMEQDSCMQWMLAASVRYFRMQHNYEEAKRQAEAVRKDYTLSELAELAICGALVELAVEAYDITALPALAKRYVEKWDWLKQHPEETRSQSQLDFPKYLAEEYFIQVVQAGAKAANASKQYEEAYSLWMRISWDKEDFDGSAYEQEFQRTIRELENKRTENMKEILITVSLLVSNRRDTIRKCMESIKPLLDAVPSELIAVDTVGEENSDGSLTIVKEYTDKIVHFDWCNDFAAARNAGLEKAKGKWFLYLDDDEWFEDITPIIKFFKEGDYKNYDRAWYYVRNYYDFSGNNYIDTLVDRMSRITKESRFEGRVHECLLPYPEKVMQFYCYVHHYGYAYKSEEEKQKHTERNSSLLEQELKENPKNARMVAQLIQEYAVVNRYKDAVQLCESWLSKNESQIVNPFTQYVIVMWLRMTIGLGNWDASAELLHSIEQKYALKEAPRLACIVEATCIESERKQYDEVLRRTKEYFELKQRIDKGIPDLAVQQILDLTKYTGEEENEKVMLRASNAMAETGQYEMANEIFDKINWSDEQKKPFAFMVQLVELYGKSGRGDLFFPYAEKIISNPQMKNPFMVSLEGLCRDYPERKDKVSEWLQKRTMPQQKKQISPEMQKLAEQLKQNIKSLIEMGQQEAADELIKGLRELMPEDGELTEDNDVFIF